MSDDMEKLIKSLPPIRIDEPLYAWLVDRSVATDRKLSDVVRLMLLQAKRHFDMLAQGDEGDKQP